MRPAELESIADSSFANNRDLFSQFGYIVLLFDSVKSHIVQYIRNKRRTIVWSVLIREFFASADYFDCTFSIKHDPKHITNRHISFQMFPDSVSLFDTITECSNTEEKRLNIYIQRVEKVYDLGRISKTGIVRSKNTPADALNNVKAKLCTAKYHSSELCRFPSRTISLLFKWNQWPLYS